MCIKIDKVMAKCSRVTMRHAQTYTSQFLRDNERNVCVQHTKEEVGT